MIITIDGTPSSRRDQFTDDLVRHLNSLRERSVHVRRGISTEPLQLLKDDVLHYDQMYLWLDYWRCTVCHAWDYEWWYGRAIQTVGLRFMLIEHDQYEFAHFTNAVNFNKIILRISTDADYLDAQSYAIQQIMTFKQNHALTPPRYAGHPDTPVVFVGEQLNTKAPPPAWLPFTSSYTAKLGRIFGNDAILSGWTNIEEVPAEYLRSKFCVISCGRIAAQWVRDVVKPAYKHIEIAHPSWMFRYNTPATQTAFDAMVNIIPVVREVLHPTEESHEEQI